MTRAERERLRVQVDQAKRQQIAQAHGRLAQLEDWTDDPGHVSRNPQKGVRDRRTHAPRRPDPLDWITTAREEARQNGRLA